jgi:hypothetical protein
MFLFANSKGEMKLQELGKYFTILTSILNSKDIFHSEAGYKVSVSDSEILNFRCKSLCLIIH